MIKTEFWDDEKLATISRDSRLTYIALWNFSDDYGVVKGHHAWLKNNIFPYDEKLGLETFTKWLLELETLNRIIPFSTNGETYYYIPTFSDHQTINRPSLQRNPEPPDDIYESIKQNNTYSGSAQGVPIDEVKLSIKEKNIKIKEERNEIAKSIISLLNNLSGKNFGYGEANLEPIRGRLGEGFTKEDCAKVLQIKWDDEKFDKKYYRPATLFRPSLFEGYLNENIKPQIRYEQVG
jgi:uncharacterized phage protein (TIGR02220 family)